MQDACRYSDRPLAFLARYVRRRPVAHAAIVTAVVAAVGCSVGAQYGVKVLVDTLAGGPFVRDPSPESWPGLPLPGTPGSAQKPSCAGAVAGAPASHPV